MYGKWYCKMIGWFWGDETNWKTCYCCAGKEIGETALYFGCRHRDGDYIYEEELTDYEQTGVLTTLRVAFSRDQPEKVYVQHKLKEDAQRVWSCLEQQGYFYVCG